VPTALEASLGEKRGSYSSGDFSTRSLYSLGRNDMGVEVPVECPVAECAERATSLECCAGTFRTRHVPMGRDVTVPEERG